MTDEINIVNYDREKIFENLNRTKKGIPLIKKLKDWWIKGLQLQRGYVKHWEEISDIFERYGVDQNRQAPMITRQTLVQVRMAAKITERLKKDPEIRKMASTSSFPLKSVYPSGSYNSNQVIDGTIFIMVLDIIPNFCMEMGLEQLEQFLEDGASKDYLQEMFSICGTVMDTAGDIDKIAQRMAKEVKKGGLKR